MEWHSQIDISVNDMTISNEVEMYGKLHKNYSDERVLCSAPQTSSEKRTWERYLV